MCTFAWAGPLAAVCLIKATDVIFIFDWGHTTRKEIGPIAKEDLGSSDEGFVVLIRYTSWFRLFFIPTIPTGYRYALLDEKTNAEKEVDKVFFDTYRNLAELNRKVAEGRMDQKEYEKERANLSF